MHLYNSFKLLEILLLPSTTAPQRDLRMRPLEFMEESATPKVEPLWVDVVSYRQMAAMRLLTKEADWSSLMFAVVNAEKMAWALIW